MNYPDYCLVGDRRFLVVHQNHRTTYCIEEYAETIEQIYQGSTWVYDRLSKEKDHMPLRGRQPVIDTSLVSSRIIIKRFRRGGFISRFNPDRFLSRSRFLRILEHTEFLSQNNIKTAPVIFLTIRESIAGVQAEGGFCRLDGSDASMILFPPGRLMPADWQEKFRSIGALVAGLHKIGFIHGDLNLMNIQLDSTPFPAVLDLEKSRIYHTPVRPAVTACNLNRLIRSIRKQGRSYPAESVEAAVMALREGYTNRNA